MPYYNDSSLPAATHFADVASYEEQPDERRSPGGRAFVPERIVRAI